MKRLSIIAVVFFLQFGVGVSFIEFQHEKVQPGETIFAEIKLEKGNFTRQIPEADIKFFEGRREVFIETGIVFYEGVHYFYAYPTREGNFTLRISSILYKEGDNLFSHNIEKEFSVLKEYLTEDNVSFSEIISVKPGFSFLEKEPKIKITNLGDKIINFTADGEKVGLSPTETKEFVVLPSENLSYFKIKASKEFSVPIISKGDEVFVSKEEIYLRPSQEIILKNLIVGKKYEETIQLFNFGEENISELNVFSDLDFVEFDFEEEIPARDSRNLSVYFVLKNGGHFTGIINISYNQFNKTKAVLIHLSLFVLPKGSVEDNFTISEETCDEIGGQVCSLDEVCTGSARFTKGGEYCCLASCEKISEENGSSYKWVIGILIFLLLGFGGYYFYNKSKKVRGEKPEEKIRRISEGYGAKGLGKSV